MWDLPGPGLEPVSPALAGRFSTTAPPGKPGNCYSSFPKTSLWMDSWGLRAVRYSSRSANSLDAMTTRMGFNHHMINNVWPSEALPDTQGHITKVEKKCCPSFEEPICRKQHPPVCPITFRIPCKTVVRCFLLERSRNHWELSSTGREASRAQSTSYFILRTTLRGRRSPSQFTDEISTFNDSFEGQLSHGRAETRCTSLQQSPSHRHWRWNMPRRVLVPMCVGTSGNWTQLHRVGSA